MIRSTVQELARSRGFISEYDDGAVLPWRADLLEAAEFLAKLPDSGMFIAEALSEPGEAGDPVVECKECDEADTGAELSDEAKAFLMLLKQQPANRIVESYP